jgi:class 3 adenylate cyclase
MAPIYYLSGPYKHNDSRVSHDRVFFIKKVALDLISAGHTIYCPIVWNYAVAEGQEMEEDDTGEANFLQNLSILSACDSLLVLCMDGWENSSRLAAEIRWATKNGRPVLFLRPSNPRRFLLQPELSREKFPESPGPVELWVPPLDDESSIRCQIQAIQPGVQPGLIRTPESDGIRLPNPTIVYELKNLGKGRQRVVEFQRQHSTALLTLMFTDIVASTQLKQELGDGEASLLIHEHHAIVRRLLAQFSTALEISTAGDSFFLVFAKPSEAVKFSLLLRIALRDLSKGMENPILDRIGIHVGEVFIEQLDESSLKPKDLFGFQVDACARVMSLAAGGQILMTRFAFDNAKQVLKGEDIKGIDDLYWINHGYYQLKGIQEQLEICEVGEFGLSPLPPPPRKPSRKAMHIQH